MDPSKRQAPPDPLTNLPQFSLPTAFTKGASSECGKGESDNPEDKFLSQFKHAALAFHHLKEFQSALSFLNSNHNYELSVNFSDNSENIEVKGSQNELCGDEDHNISIDFSLDSIASQIKGPLASFPKDFYTENPEFCELLIDNPFLADARLIINESEEFTYYVHKDILVERSLYFRSMFSCEFKESNEEGIHLELKHPQSFSAVLHYLYTHKLHVKFQLDGKWRLSNEEYYNLLWNSNYLQIDSLTERLMTFFEYSLIQCDKFRNDYVPVNIFLKRMSQCVVQQHSKISKDCYGKCKKCKNYILYLETVLVYASNSNDEDICKSVMDWILKHNISKHIKQSKFVDKLANLSPMVRRMIDPIGILENMRSTCQETTPDSTPLSSKHAKNIRHNGLVMIGGQNPRV